MLALVPVKTFKIAKQRLSAMLADTDREALSRTMLTDVLGVLTRHPDMERVAVCTDDPAVQGLAAKFDIRLMPESELGCSGLNPVVNAAARVLEREGVRELMVVHGDLPMLGADELTRMIDAHRNVTTPAVTLVPDSRRDGTNLMAWNPASAFRTCYGAASFRKHCEQARELGMAANVCLLPAAALDIDEPDDLLRLAAMDAANVAQATREFLRNNSSIMNRLQAGLHQTERIRA